MAKLDDVPKVIIDTKEALKPIIGTKNIINYMGIGAWSFYALHKDKMIEYGCLCKSANTRFSPLITTPLLINLYLTLCSIDPGERKYVSRPEDINRIRRWENDNKALQNNISPFNDIDGVVN